MDRRTFLMSAGAALAPAGARFENPFFALCMDTHDEKKRNLAGQAQMLKELGYNGAGHLWFDNLAERLATLDRAGLRLFQVYMRVDAGPQAKQAYDAKLSEVLPLDGGGHILVDLWMQTQIPGVFAAGEVRQHSAKQVAAAVGDGVTAAIAAQRYLRGEGA